MEGYNKKRFQGVVESDKMDKTVVVSIKTIKPHKKYRKMVSFDKKCMAHNPGNKCKIGDRIAIEEAAPFSKCKKWVVVEVISNGS